MVTVIMEQRGPEVKCEQSEILPTRFGHWFHKLPELLALFTVKLLAEMLLPDVTLLIAVLLKQGLHILHILHILHGLYSLHSLNI